MRILVEHLGQFLYLIVVEDYVEDDSDDSLLIIGIILQIF